jgi:hypothetical protein
MSLFWPVCKVYSSSKHALWACLMSSVGHWERDEVKRLWFTWSLKDPGWWNLVCKLGSRQVMQGSLFFPIRDTHIHHHLTAEMLQNVGEPMDIQWAYDILQRHWVAYAIRKIVCPHIRFCIYRNHPWSIKLYLFEFTLWLFLIFYITMNIYCLCKKKNAYFDYITKSKCCWCQSVEVLCVTLRKGKR